MSTRSSSVVPSRDYRRSSEGTSLALGMLSALVICLGAARQAMAQSPVGGGVTVETATIENYGIYVGEHDTWVPIEKSLSGKIQQLKNIRLVEQTDEICPRRGLMFGFRFKLHGAPIRAPVSILVRTNFPGEGLRLPNGSRRMSSEHMTSRLIGQTWGWTHTFNHDWQMISGQWVFEVRYESRLLARKEFTVQCTVS